MYENKHASYPLFLPLKYMCIACFSLFPLFSFFFLTFYPVFFLYKSIGKSERSIYFLHSIFHSTPFHQRIHRCIHTYIHTYIHPHIHTYIHTYTPTYLLVLDVLGTWHGGDGVDDQLLGLVDILGRQAFVEKDMLRLLRLMHTASPSYRPELGLLLLVRIMHRLYACIRVCARNCHYYFFFHYPFSFHLLDQNMMRTLIAYNSPSHFFDLCDLHSVIFVPQVEQPSSSGKRYRRQTFIVKGKGAGAYIESCRNVFIFPPRLYISRVATNRIQSICSVRLQVSWYAFCPTFYTLPINLCVLLLRTVASWPFYLIVVVSCAFRPRHGREQSLVGYLVPGEGLPRSLPNAYLCSTRDDLLEPLRCP